MQPGIIWVTGLPGSGKSSVAADVVRLLGERSHPAIHLDGEDLRFIVSDLLATTKEYETDTRRHLALSYFRLGNYLANQGFTVVVSAVAMFRETEEWLDAFATRSLIVKLETSEDVRRERSIAQGKKTYKGTYQPGVYDDLTRIDLIFAESDKRTITDIAEEIVAVWGAATGDEVVEHKNQHWNQFYSEFSATQPPSPFAESVVASISPGSRILEVGCGTGRDAVFFQAAGHHVVALDESQAAISGCEAHYPDSGVAFRAGRVVDLGSQFAGSFDVVFSRFVLHAMTASQQQDFLAAVMTLLAPGGRLLIEARSMNDPMALLGEILSPSERHHGHYRRFLRKEALEAEVTSAGLSVVDLVEKNGLAVYGEEDPMVIRLVAQKP
jgi:adenylylsulfate kinase-like enzyme/2-polyprenyl-3-methyl-5-hydroxy-6-metoxy-1,4-benzoquinol methylase